MIQESQAPSIGHRALFEKARGFLELFHQEMECMDELEGRILEVGTEILATGTYFQKAQELEYGARMAWRNSTRCVGRHYWRALELIDARQCEGPEEMFDEIVSYLRHATNDGKIRSCILAFQPAPLEGPGPRIWNDQLIRYAGYRQDDGTVIGDPSQVAITEQLQELGWPGGEGTPFDVLPILIEVPGRSPEWFELPPDAVLEVELEHPDYPKFNQGEYRWHGVPSISNMRLEVGGLSYTAAPFNGWYMGTEVGARNLADIGRYNLLPVMAEAMELDTSKESTLWRDRALVELNVAVLHSYAQAGVKMVDHHTCTEHFVRFEEREAAADREVHAEWEWMVPPISGSATPVFHRKYEDRQVTPNFFYQDSPDQEEEGKCPFGHDQEGS